MFKLIAKYIKKRKMKKIRRMKMLVLSRKIRRNAKWQEQLEVMRSSGFGRYE